MARRNQVRQRITSSKLPRIPHKTGFSFRYYSTPITCRLESYLDF